METLKTGCDRLAYAADRIKTKGWTTGKLRPLEVVDGELHVVADGPACLLGSLVLDSEVPDKCYNFYALLDTLPGVQEACRLMNFASTSEVYKFNDQTTQATVEARIATARAAHCKPEATNDAL